MAWRKLGVLAAVMLVAASTPTAAAGAPHWEATLLPLPADGQGVHAEVDGSDGHGGYVGMLYRDDGPIAVARWDDGRLVVQEAPDGGQIQYVAQSGESRDGTVLLSTSLGYVTLDRAGGYHPVPTGSFANVETTLIGPNGDLVGRADDPAEPDREVTLYWSSPSAEPVVLAGLLPHSVAKAIDDDGSVLFNSFSGPYLMRQGVVRKLALPSASWATKLVVTIRHGFVAGHGNAATNRPNIGLVWRSPDSPQVQENSHQIFGVNSYGLSVGEEYVPGRGGPMAVWLNGHELGRLPAPDGYQITTARFVDENGTIAGTVASKSHVSPDLPALWRLVRG